MVFESGRPVAHVARGLGIHHETLRKWVRQTEADEGKRSELLSSEEREHLIDKGNWPPFHAIRALTVSGLKTWAPIGQRAGSIRPP